RFPVRAINFVTTDVNVFRWKDVHYLGEHILRKLEGGRKTGTDRCGEEFSECVVSFATEKQVRSDCRHHVTGHVYFRNDIDVPVHRILHDAAHFFLRVESSIESLAVSLDKMFWIDVVFRILS